MSINVATEADFDKCLPIVVGHVEAYLEEFTEQTGANSLSAANLLFMHSFRLLMECGGPDSFDFARNLVLTFETGGSATTKANELELFERMNSFFNSMAITRGTA